jgi:hypothetical protein
MSRRALLIITLGLVMTGVGFWSASGQDGGQFEEVLITTGATDAVGVGDYVAAQAFGFPATEEEPVQTIILPYGIYPDMHVAAIEDFTQPEPLTEDLTFEWSLTAPEGSSAELITGNVAIFRADVEGAYDLTLTATDAEGNTGEATWRVHATTYVGSGFLDGPEPNNEDQCIDCHQDIAEAWLLTNHADTFERALNGELSDHFGADCTSCHVTGFNNREGADNGGFDDLAAASDWTFPEELGPGGWATFAENHPEVAAMANVQCESCHGPGYAHVFEATRAESMIGSGLHYGTCAQCHAEEPYLTIPQQWENSNHGDLTSRGFTYPVGEDERNCVRCHSGAGFIDHVAGLPQEELRVDYQPITCAVCHDPHSVENPNQLRVFDVITLPDGTEVEDAGPAATCMTCHNARRDGGAEGQVASALEGGRFSAPHHDNNHAELIAETGGYTWGMDLPTTTHGRVTEDACITCHMGEGPGTDEDGRPLAGYNEIGGHTFAMVSEEGVANISVCTDCHDSAGTYPGESDFAFESRRDYDGDGAIESVQQEITGLRDLIWAELSAAGVVELEGYPFIEIPEGSSEDVYGAVWNYYFTANPGTAVHNFRYSAALLQLTYEQLTGEPVPNATILPVEAMEAME